MNLKKLNLSNQVANVNVGLTITNSESGMRGALNNVLLAKLGFVAADFVEPNKGKKKVQIAVYEEEKELLIFSNQNLEDITRASITGTYKHPKIYTSAVFKHALAVAGIDLQVNKSVKLSKYRWEEDADLNIDILVFSLGDVRSSSKKQKKPEYLQEEELPFSDGDYGDLGGGEKIEEAKLDVISDDN